MKAYTKPLVDVYELRVNENIAASKSAEAKWAKYGNLAASGGVWVTETDLALGGGSY